MSPKSYICIIVLMAHQVLSSYWRTRGGEADHHHHPPHDHHSHHHHDHTLTITITITIIITIDTALIITMTIALIISIIITCPAIGGRGEVKLMSSLLQTLSIPPPALTVVIMGIMMEGDDDVHGGRII